MQVSWKQLKSDSTSWQSTLTSSHNLQNQWHVGSTLYHEMKNQLTRKVGFEGIPKLDPCWKSQPATYVVNTEWKSELCLWTETALTPGSEFLMGWTNWSRTSSTRSTTTTSRRPLRRSLKNSRWNRMHVLLRADQRLKRNHKDVFLPAHTQELYLSVKGLGLLSQKLIRLSITPWQKDRTLFFGMVTYLEKKTERLNSGDWKMIFRGKLRTLSIGLMKCGRAKWQEAEAKRKDFNTVLTRQDKKLFTFELFKVIQNAIPLLLHFTGIHDRFLRDPIYRESQLAIGWTEQKCKEMDELAKEDHTCKLTPEERRRYKGQMVSHLEQILRVRYRLGHRPVVLLRTETVRCTVRPT